MNSPDSKVEGQLVFVCTVHGAQRDKTIDFLPESFSMLAEKHWMVNLARHTESHQLIFIGCTLLHWLRAQAKSCQSITDRFCPRATQDGDK